MTDDKTVYGLALEIQPKEIEAYCFGLCGKIIIGSMALEVDDISMTLLPCRQADCPYLHSQTDDPIGTVDGNGVILRRLIDAPNLDAKGGEA